MSRVHAWVNTFENYPFRSSLLQRQADVAIVYFGYCNVRPLGALQSDVALCQRIAMLEAWSNVNEPFDFNATKYVENINFK